jgi:thioredoxin-related protein
MRKPGYRLLHVLLAAWLMAAATVGCDRSPGTQDLSSDSAPATAVPSHQSATPAGELDAGLVNPGYQEYPAWFVNSFLDLREDIAEAEAAGKRVLLYFYQDGCPYCKKLLETNFALADTVRYTRAHFAVIAINLWGDREVTGLQGEATTEKAFAKAMRVMFTPTLLFLDERGDVVLRLNGYYPPHRFSAALDYAAGYSGSDPSFREYLARVSPAPASGRLHTDPLALPPGTDLAARRSGKPLLVVFEQKDCAPCDELHDDVLQHPEARAQLARFDVVVLDMWSPEPVRRPDGRSGSRVEWARELNVKYAPSLVFFDADNREVFRTEAWLRTFHIVSALDYVASRAYLEYPEFQRYISARADRLEAQGAHIDLME